MALNIKYLDIYLDIYRTLLIKRLTLAF